MERLTSEQIGLLENLKALYDDGILTEVEFEAQVDKVLGRFQVLEDSAPETGPTLHHEFDVVIEDLVDGQRDQLVDGLDVVEGPAATNETGLLEFVFVDTQGVDDVEILAADEEGAEAQLGQVASDSFVAEAIGVHQSSGRKKMFVGAMAGFLLLGVVALVVITGGEGSVSTPTSNVEETFAQSTPVATTQVSMSSVTTSTTTASTIAPTTTYEIPECPYTRVIEAVDGRIVTPEAITFDLRPATYIYRLRDGHGAFREDNGYQAGIEVENSTNFRLRIGMELEWSWPNGSKKVQWEPDNGRGWINGFEARTIGVPDEVIDSREPITEIQLTVLKATIQYLCP